MYVVFLFQHRKSVQNLVCDVCMACTVYCCQPSFRDWSYLHIASYRCLELIDGWCFHVFLANTTMNLYLKKTTTSSVFFFFSTISVSTNSVKKSVMYCSCSSLGMRETNGLTAFMASDIKKHKHISKRITYHIASLMTVPGHSYTRECNSVTQCLLRIGNMLW